MAKGPKAPIPNKPGKTNWVEKAGGLPDLIKRSAEHILAQPSFKGDVSRAIATAVNWAKTMCSTGRAFGGKVQVSPKAQAAACKAVASWEAKKGAGRARETPLDVLFDAVAGAELGELDEATEQRMLEAAEAMYRDGDVCVLEVPVDRLLEAGMSRQERHQRRQARRDARTRSGDNANFEAQHPRGRGGSWTLKHGDSGGDVKAVQKKVGAKDDGHFGEKTTKAVKDFQKKNGLTVDGIVGAQTMAALNGDAKAKHVHPGPMTTSAGKGKKHKRAREAPDDGGTMDPMKMTVEVGDLRALEAPAAGDGGKVDCPKCGKNVTPKVKDGKASCPNCGAALKVAGEQRRQMAA